MRLEGCELELPPHNIPGNLGAAPVLIKLGADIKPLS